MVEGLMHLGLSFGIIVHIFLENNWVGVGAWRAQGSCYLGIVLLFV
jgi:hypothetical protein